MFNIKIYSLLFFALINIISIIISIKDKTNSDIGNKSSVFKESESRRKLKTNLDLYYEFFQIKSVKDQIQKKNLTYIETLSGGFGNVGNALIMLNKWINICEKIRCKNIIVPGGGLENIIKSLFSIKNII